MNVYIAYDNYGSGESFTVFNVETNRTRAIQHFRNVDLPDLISICPDDCHSLQLEKVVMTRADYLELCDLAKGEQTVTEGRMYDVLSSIFDEEHHGWYETIFVSNGYDDFQTLLDIYCRQHNLDADCGVDCDKAINELAGNLELIKEMFKRHLARYYYVSKVIDVYITYDRYEHDEWYSVYHIDTDENSALTHFTEVDLPDFICYGPDDCHSFVLQRVPMTVQEYKRLCFLNGPRGDNRELEEMLYTFYHEEREAETLFFTDGCSDAYAVEQYYFEQIGCDDDDDEGQDAARDELYSDDELFKRILREYIDANY